MPRAIARDGAWLARAAHALVVAVVSLAIVASVLIAVGTAASEFEPSSDPGFVDMVFASRIVVGAARIGAVFVAGYVVCSILVGMAERRYLTGVGPVRTGTTPSIEDLYEERNELRQSLADAQDLIEAMEAELHQCKDPLESQLDQR